MCRQSWASSRRLSGIGVQLLSGQAQEYVLEVRGPELRGLAARALLEVEQGLELVGAHVGARAVLVHRQAARLGERLLASALSVNGHEARREAFDQLGGG